MTLAVQLKGLEKTYANGTQALRGIDLTVEEGDFFALLGPNGAGKSTAIGILSSLVRKSAGQVEVFGHNLDTEPELVKSKIGLVPQEFNFNQFEPVVEIVINQGGFYGMPRRQAYERARHILTTLELWGKKDVQARELSGGMKRRLMIARALIHKPRLLILDEPTAGVDIEIRHTMWEFMQEINAAGTTIILTTHYLEEAESLCRHIAIINQGQIAEHAKMDELLRRLHAEVFVLSTAAPVPDDIYDSQFRLQPLQECTLEAEVRQGQSINDLFEVLSQKGVKILSLRNKQNRLEQFFVDRIKNGNYREQARS